MATCALIAVIAPFISFQYRHQNSLNAELEDAIDKGDIELARQLIAKDADVNGRIYLGPFAVDGDAAYRSVVRAMEQGNDDMMRLLIESGADLYFSEPKYYESAVRWALYYRKVDAATYLIYEAPGFDIEREDVNELLLLSASCGDVELVGFWIQHGADPAGALNKTGDMRGTPLNRAVMDGHVAVVEALIDHGAPLNEVGAGYPFGTPLTVACENALPEMVDRLIVLGADVNLLSDGAAPLHYAVRSGGSSIVHALLEAGADRTLTDANGYTATAVAEQAERPDIVRLLAERDVGRK